jgi:3-deoxy-7-phosphoheptulonate synthase
MNAKATQLTADSWPAPVDKTSQTDDERIHDVTPLPPPEHLIRFFPIRGTPVESLVADRRPPAGGDRAVLDPRPKAAMEYARKLKAEAAASGTTC